MTKKKINLNLLRSVISEQKMPKKSGQLKGASPSRELGSQASCWARADNPQSRHIILWPASFPVVPCAWSKL